jgi:hypothetical protein
VSVPQPAHPLARLADGHFAPPLRSASAPAAPPPAGRLRVAYARASTDAQDLTAQRHALASLGVAPLAAERVSKNRDLT